MDKIRFILLVILFAVVGCQRPQRTKPTIEPPPRFEMPAKMKIAVMNLVYLKSDPNIFKIKEVDPFGK